MPISACALPSPMMGSFSAQKLLAHTIQNAFSFRDAVNERPVSPRRVRDAEAWNDCVCHHLGHCGLPTLSPCEYVVCGTVSYDDATAPCILSFSEPDRGVLLCLEVYEPMSLLEAVNSVAWPQVQRTARDGYAM